MPLIRNFNPSSETFRPRRSGFDGGLAMKGRTRSSSNRSVASAIGAETLATADRIMARAAGEIGFHVAMFG
jgi:hypothetical protein